MSFNTWRDRFKESFGSGSSRAVAIVSAFVVFLGGAIPVYDFIDRKFLAGEDEADTISVSLDGLSVEGGRYSGYLEVDHNIGELSAGWQCNPGEIAPATITGNGRVARMKITGSAKSYVKQVDLQTGDDELVRINFDLLSQEVFEVKRLQGKPCNNISQLN